MMYLNFVNGIISKQEICMCIYMYVLQCLAPDKNIIINIHYDIRHS